MSWCCKKLSTWNKKLILWENSPNRKKFYGQTKEEEEDFRIPSPNPKHGIKLSSSNAAKVFPIIEIACSYGFKFCPMWCRLRPPKDLLPKREQMPLSIFNCKIKYHIQLTRERKKREESELNLSIHCSWWNQYPQLDLKTPSPLVQGLQSPDYRTMSYFIMRRRWRA